MAAHQSHSWHQFPAGTKVLDTVTGEDGVVVTTNLTHALIPPSNQNGAAAAGQLLPLPTPVTHESVVVKLGDGTTVERSPRTLLAL